MDVDICIFYSEPDKDKVELMDSILSELGWKVWWSKDIKHSSWPPEIEKNIKKTKCVIVIWNTRAISEGSYTFEEVFKARSLKKPIITLISEKNIIPPFPFESAHITSDITEWDGNRKSECVDVIVNSLESVLGIAPIKWKGERPNEINLMGKQIKLPCFVKSISSHETQLNPEAGLTVLSLFPNIDAILISAYDLHIDNLNGDNGTKEKLLDKMKNKLVEFNEHGVFIILDSGNYEKSRKHDDTWDKDMFNEVLSQTVFTYAFCFDDLYPDKNVQAHVNNIISSVKGEYEDYLIPIIHAPLEKEKRLYRQLPEIFFEYAKRNKSPIIAVPERELGEGMKEKINTVMMIRERLNTLDYYQPIHILGTGNPLSIVLLAAAGADFFDGLEWCRTVADRNTGFLFHHQQFDFFKSQAEELANSDLVREAMKDEGLGYNLKMALHNLDFFDEWMDELQRKIIDNSVSDMLAYRAMFTTRDFIDELRKVMPGLFR